MEKNESRFLYEQFLKCIDREEGLIHYRTSWGLQWNGALLVAFAALYNISERLNPFLYYFGLSIIIACGLLVTWIMREGISAADTQVEYLIIEICFKLGLIKSRISIKEMASSDIYKNIWENTEFLRPYGDPRDGHLRSRKISFYLPFMVGALWLIPSLWSVTGLIQQIRNVMDRMWH